MKFGFLGKTNSNRGLHLQMITIDFLLYTTIAISATLAQLSHDVELEKMCTRTSGTFIKRESSSAIVGDTCQMPFYVATEDDDDARNFCELYAPWRLLKVERTIDSSESPTTICHVEATFTCENGWIQMFGHCIRMPDKYQVATYDEAEKICDNEKKGIGKIAFMHHRYIVGVWKRNFRKLEHIWVRASEAWDQYVVKTGTVDGDALALSFAGKNYNFAVQANSLIKIKRNIRLQVLCEYKPPMTAAEINYLGRRYSEIYYQSVPVSLGILVRTASSYTNSSRNVDVCDKTLKPYHVEKVSSFVPNEPHLTAMKVYQPTLFQLTRSGAQADVQNTLQPDWCTKGKYFYKVKVNGSDSGDYVLKELESTCENMLSAAIAYFPNQDPDLRAMSDSRSLPLWCKLGHHFQFTYEIPSGWQKFIRANGEIVAHKLYTGKMNFESARQACKNEGALLSGVNDDKEAEFLKKMVIENKYNDAEIWLGSMRKPECDWVTPFDAGDNRPCSRNKVYAWLDNVAQDFYTHWWRDGKNGANPDHSERNQKCITFVYGNPRWAIWNSPGFLDDNVCGLYFPYFCLKKINVKLLD